MTLDEQWEQKARKYVCNATKVVYFVSMVRSLLRIIDKLRKGADETD